MAVGRPLPIMRPMTADGLCSIELVAEHQRTPCPREACAYWENAGCLLMEVGTEVSTRPEVATLLLRLRRELEQAVPHRPLHLVHDVA